MSATANAGLIWSVAELLRGDYKQADYGRVILPFTLLRRLDCVLAPTRREVWDEVEKCKHLGVDLGVFLASASRLSFYNTSRFDFARLLGEPNFVKANLLDFINGFSPNARDVFERYEFAKQLDKLDGANLLFQTVQKFAGFDLRGCKRITSRFRQW